MDLSVLEVVSSSRFQVPWFKFQVDLLPTADCRLTVAKQSGLQPLVFESYRMAIELEEQLNASFPLPGDKERLKEMIVQDEGRDELGVNVQQIDGKYFIHYPVSIFLGRKA